MNFFELVFVVTSIFVGTYAFVILTIGLDQRKAYKTHRDPKFPCATAAQYVWTTRQSKRHILVGGGSFIIMFGLTAKAFVELAGVELFMFMFIWTLYRLDQHDRMLDTPIPNADYNDYTIHLLPPAQKGKS